MTGGVLVSANIGGLDPPLALPESRLGSVYFTDGAPPRGWRHVVSVDRSENPRLAAKRYKCQIHRLEATAGAAWFAWADAAFEFRTLDFIPEVLADLDRSGRDAAFVPHPARRSPAEEYAHILEGLAMGSAYLASRYDAESLEWERDHFAERHDLDSLPLWCGGFWIAQNTPRVRAFLDAWWTVVRRCMLDQAAISPLLEEHGVRVRAIPVPIYECRWWRHRSHA